MKKIRPFLKWAGSKYNCIQKVVAALTDGKRLIEPFTGSGAVFMNTSYPRYLLAEANADLVNLYTTLQEQGSDFINYCQAFFTPETNCKDYYYQSRSLFNNSQLAYEKSALFLYLNRHGYNGLCRYNAQGIYNVPFGQYKKPYFPLKELHDFYTRSAQVEFMHQDFRTTFTLAERGDVLYCDPPYVPISQGTQVVHYTSKVFTNEDQIELAYLAQQTAARGIPVIISNHDTEFTRTHYQKAQIMSFPVTRVINCQSYSRKPVNELIAVFK